MSEPIKPRIDFDQPLNSPIAPHFGSTRAFEKAEAESFVLLPPVDEAVQDSLSQPELALESVLSPKRSLWQRLVMSGAILFGISVIAQIVQWSWQAWQQQDWIALGSGAAGFLIIAAGTGAGITEWRRLFRLRQRAASRDEARILLASHGMGQGRAFCENLAQKAGLDRAHPALQRWLASIHESHSDREVVTLYANLVQPVLDRQARKEIGRSAAESTLLIAVSPLALVDMAFIAWRNLRLLNRIAALYGIELGYLSRLRLFRMVLVNIAFAGASELVREMGMDWLGQDIAARLSARAAQGIGAGLLTARLGIKAMELCRPLPWLDNDQPRLSDYRHDLIIYVKQALNRKSEAND